MEEKVAEKREKIDARYPKISDEELKSLYGRIKPVVRGSHIGSENLNGFVNRWAIEKELSGKELGRLKEKAPKKLFWVKNENPRNVAFNWDPAPTGVAKGLKEVGRIKTYHTYGYYGFFKPLVAEVLAQIPAQMRENVVAFETQIAKGNVLKALTKDQEYHQAETTLYALSRGAKLRSIFSKGVVRQVLKGEEREWDAKREAKAKATEIAEQNKKAEEAVRNIKRYVSEAEAREDQISYYAEFRPDFETLLRLRMSSREADELSGLLKKFNAQLESGELNIFKAGLVLQELSKALNRVDPFYLSQEETNGISSHAPCSPWEVETEELSRKVLERAYKGLRGGELKSYSAEWLMWQARPFVRNTPHDQLFLVEIMRPVFEAIARDFRWEDKGLMERLRD